MLTASVVSVPVEVELATDLLLKRPGLAWVVYQLKAMPRYHCIDVDSLFGAGWHTINACFKVVNYTYHITPASNYHA